MRYFPYADKTAAIPRKQRHNGYLTIRFRYMETNAIALLCYSLSIYPPFERLLMTKISKQDVSYVASLAQLSLDEAAQERLVREMGDILAYMDTLNALDTSEVEPMMHALEMTNILREDVPGAPLPREEALKNAPVDNGEHFIVPIILEGEDGS